MKDGERKVCINLDPKGFNKIDFMNNMAQVLQILHEDPKVKWLEFGILGGGKDGKVIVQSFEFKLL